MEEKRVKCAGKQQQLVDRISDLPTDILVKILSFLPLKHAARTSILSKCWIELWKSVSRLDLVAENQSNRVYWIDDPAEYYRSQGSSHCKYVKWVDKVLQCHKAMVLDLFRLRIDLDNDSNNDIDRWIRYAFARRVERMILDFIRYRNGDPWPREKAYTFPHDLGPGMDINSDLFLGSKFLKELSFLNVNVSQEVVSFFLQHCCFLEHLRVANSVLLKELEVRGPSLALKHLEIKHCQLNSLTVSDTNIVSLKVSQVGERLVLKNVPMLVDVYVGAFHYSSFLSSAVSLLLSSCLTNLQVLSLEIYTAIEEQGPAVDFAIPQLPKLKQLFFLVYGREVNRLDRLTCLIRACPNLEKFILQLCWSERNSAARETTGLKKAALSSTAHHHHLKSVGVIAYYGGAAEVELITYCIENCVALDRIGIYPLRSWFIPGKIDEEKDEITTNIVKQQLQELVPSYIDLRVR